MNVAKKQGNNIIPIAMMFLLFFIISFVTGLQNPLGVIVKDQFGLSNFQSQLGNMCNFLAYLFMGIPSGMLLQSIGYKKTALVALVVGLLGVVVMYLGGISISFYTYLAGAFISGFSMCMLNAVVNPMLTVLGSEKGANQRLNFGGALNSVGATLAPVLGGMVMGNLLSPTINDAQPLIFIAMGIFILVGVVLFLVDIPEPHLTIKTDNKIKDSHSALSFTHFKLGMIAIFIYVGVEVMIPNITNLYLTDAEHGLGYSKDIAGSIVGVYWILMLAGRLLGGFLGSVFTSKQMMIGVSTIGIFFILMAIFLGTGNYVSVPAISKTLSIEMQSIPLSVLFLILCGLCTSVMWPGIFNLATAGLGKHTAQGAGLFMMMVVGGGVIPLIQAKVADLIGYQFSYIVTIVCLVYLLYYAFIGCKNVNKDIVVE